MLPWNETQELVREMIARKRERETLGRDARAGRLAPRSARGAEGSPHGTEGWPLFVRNADLTVRASWRAAEGAHSGSGTDRCRS